MKFPLRKLIVASIFFFPLLSLAAWPDYQPLSNVNLPNGQTLYSSNILDYLSNIYVFAIAIAGALAVVKIVYAGIKYMLTDIVTSKGDAKKEIEAAVMGLLVALGSWVLLYTINPDLVTLRFNIGASNPIIGNGSYLMGSGVGGVGTSGGGNSVSGGKASTPGVNTPPVLPGSEINPPAFPSSPDGGVLPEKDGPPTTQPAENSPSAAPTDVKYDDTTGRYYDTTTGKPYDIKPGDTFVPNDHGGDTVTPGPINNKPGDINPIEIHRNEVPNQLP